MRAGTRCTTRTQGQQGRGKGVCVGVHTKRTARVDAYRYWVYYVRRSHTHGRTQDINEGMTVYGRSIMHETPSMIVNNAHAWRLESPAAWERRTLPSANDDAGCQSH
jgi:hypothetical protein